MKTQINIIVGVTVAISGAVSAQTVNTGEMVVLPGTVLSTVDAFSDSATGTLTNDGEFILYSDFNNDGEVKFTPGETGYTRFEGATVAQKITGLATSDDTKFYDVKFNNASVQPAFQLVSDISISGTSDFVNGIVDGDDFGGGMIFENGAAHFNTDNDSHMDGYVQKNGGLEEFTFPVGDGGFFRFSKISPTTGGSVGDAYVSKYFLENSNDLFPHANKVGNLETIDNTEYWTVDKEGTAAETMLTLSWDQATTPSFIWHDLDVMDTSNEKLTIARWDETQNLWLDQGGIIEFGNSGNTAGTVTTLLKPDAYGVFTIARVKRNTQDDGNVFIYNAVSPNGDGQNDYFIIDGITEHPKNHVTIVNRYGTKVYETSNYDSNGNVFNGFSNNGLTVNTGEKLPAGTYYYFLDYEMASGTGTRKVQKAGYLYLNDD